MKVYCVCSQEKGLVKGFYKEAVASAYREKAQILFDKLREYYCKASDKCLNDKYEIKRGQHEKWMVFNSRSEFYYDLFYVQNITVI